MPLSTEPSRERIQLPDSDYLNTFESGPRLDSEWESEEWMRTIFEEAPLGIALIDSFTGHIYVANRKFAEIVGRTREELATIDGMSITHPDDIQEDLDNMALLNSGKLTGFSMQKRYIHYNGSFIWMNMTIAKLRVVEKSNPRHLCMIEDITEQKRTDALLQNDNQILEMITSAAQFSDILEAIVKNIELLSNNALCSILLLDEDGIHLRHGAASSLPEDYNCAIDGMAIGENTGSCGTAAYRKEVVIVSDIASDPSWINYRELALKHGLKACWSTPITDVHGRVLGTFAMYYLEPRLPEPFDLKLIERATHQATIVIERNQADNKILRINADLVRSETRERLARETAEHTSELKSKFLDIAAHELRTPITAFSLLLQITQRSLEKGQPVEVNTLVRLRSQANRIARLVIDLLDVSRLERGLTVLQKVPTNIVSLISECIIEYQLLEPTRQFNFLSLDDGFDKSEAKVLDIDPVRINQVLTNLLDNAAKYTPKDSPIEVMITKLPNTLHVSVIDHGAGISPEHQKKLFTAFSRGKSDTVTKSAGLGLGLFICRAIIDLHLGTIGVLSEEGKGSTFYFELPRKAI